MEIPYAYSHISGILKKGKAVFLEESCVLSKINQISQAYLARSTDKTNCSKAFVEEVIRSLAVVGYVMIGWNQLIRSFIVFEIDEYVLMSRIELHKLLWSVDPQFETDRWSPRFFSIRTAAIVKASNVKPIIVVASSPRLGIPRSQAFAARETFTEFVSIVDQLRRMMHPGNTCLMLHHSSVNQVSDTDWRLPPPDEAPGPRDGTGDIDMERPEKLIPIPHYSTLTNGLVNEPSVMVALLENNPQNTVLSHVPQQVAHSKLPELFKIMEDLVSRILGIPSTVHSNSVRMTSDPVTENILMDETVQSYAAIVGELDLLLASRCAEHKLPCDPSTLLPHVTSKQTIRSLILSLAVVDEPTSRAMIGTYFGIDAATIRPDAFERLILTGAIKQ
jgi:hypothetical protein